MRNPMQDLWRLLVHGLSGTNTHNRLQWRPADALMLLFCAISEATSSQTRHPSLRVDEVPQLPKLMNGMGLQEGNIIGMILQLESKSVGGKQSGRRFLGLDLNYDIATGLPPWPFGICLPRRLSFIPFVQNKCSTFHFIVNRALIFDGD